MSDRGPLSTLPADELEALRAASQSRLEDARQLGLALDMTRGKPSPEQLELASGLLTCLVADDFRAEDGTDCRNYGGLEGLPETRRLLAPLLDVGPDEVLIGGNASLALFHDCLVQALLRGVPGGEGAWGAGRVKMLCPTPGYDRHFSICKRYGIEMIPVAMGEEGPDLEEVGRLARDDGEVRGIICVPKYSNPTGVTYSDEVVRALAAMKTRAPDFRIFCDNAYSAHHLYEPGDRLLPLLETCRREGHPDRPFLFGSTSKISLAGAGVSLMAASSANLEFMKDYRKVQTIGPDKLNQLRHVRFFGDFSGIEAHMRRHAELLRPRFEAVLETLDERLRGLEVASWSRPRGGYFISLDLPSGGAARVVELAATAGVKLTPAGATHPSGSDPDDRNLRIAPSFPSVGELRQATEILAAAVVAAACERALASVS